MDFDEYFLWAELPRKSSLLRESPIYVGMRSGSFEIPAESGNSESDPVCPESWTRDQTSTLNQKSMHRRITAPHTLQGIRPLALAGNPSLRYGFANAQPPLCVSMYRSSGIELEK